MSAAVLDAAELLELALLAAALTAEGAGVELLPPLLPQATRIELSATRLRYLVALLFGMLMFCILIFCIGAFRVVSDPELGYLMIVNY